jgi:DUF4097 and DUF4098 domain-containing protein YvlB
MTIFGKYLSKFNAHAKTTAIVFGVVFFLLSSFSASFAQSKFSASYPVNKTIRLQLTNRTGTVTVEGWDKKKIEISAFLEAPAAVIVPQNLEGTIVINLVKDNQEKNVGSVNFTIKVPFETAVDIETLMGNLSVSNVSGTLVRAHITSEGDITLTNINSENVAAENMIGDIFFDGDIKDRGNYRFTCVRGNINLRIPFDASFRVVATAPSTRNIALGALSNSGFRFVSEGKRVLGEIGTASATLTVTNQRGSIFFLRR